MINDKYIKLITENALHLLKESQMNSPEEISLERLQNLLKSFTLLDDKFQIKDKVTKRNPSGYVLNILHVASPDFEIVITRHLNHFKLFEFGAMVSEKAKDLEDSLRKDVIDFDLMTQYDIFKSIIGI